MYVIDGDEVVSSPISRFIVAPIGLAKKIDREEPAMIVSMACQMFASGAVSPYSLRDKMIPLRAFYQMFVDEPQENIMGLLYSWVGRLGIPYLDWIKGKRRWDRYGVKDNWSERPEKD